MRFQRPFRGRGGTSNPVVDSLRIGPQRSYIHSQKPRNQRNVQIVPSRSFVPMPRDGRGRLSHGRVCKARNMKHEQLNDNFFKPESSRFRHSHDRLRPSSSRSECLLTGTSRSSEHLAYHSNKSGSKHSEYLQGGLLPSSVSTEYSNGVSPGPRSHQDGHPYQGSERIINCKRLPRQVHLRSPEQRLEKPPRSPSTFISSLEKWKTLHPADIIQRLQESGSIVKEFVENEVVCSNMEILVGALGKACSYPKGTEIIREILAFLNKKKFLDISMNPWIAQWKLDGSADASQTEMFEWVVLFLRGMIQEVPESMNSIKVSLIVVNKIIQHFEEIDAKISPMVKLALKELPQPHVTLPHESKQLPTSKKDRSGMCQDEAPEDFRNMSILPISRELQIDFKPFLRTNIVNGSYDNIHHYLDVHFRLLREDFVQPLREGIAAYLTEISQDVTEKKNFQNLRFYDNVHAIDVKPSRDGFVYLLQFDVNDCMKRIRWEVSKRLIYGSLVCLSRDDFKTLIFGHVENRDVRQLIKGRVEVAINTSNDESKDLFSFSFKMAESPSYFEAYRHVLRSLQTIDQENFPFKQYLVSLSDNVGLPKYIKENPGVKFTLCTDGTSQVNKQSEKPCKSLPANQLSRVISTQVQVNLENDWPNADELGFDESQMKAYKAALREELCLIQGPPGTGKTYVGLKIVQTLLKNKKKFGNKPLLVVCYTNHALDQFLEGILKMETKVVRIGGKSSSDKISEVNLSRVARERGRCHRHLKHQFSALRDSLKKCVNNMEQLKYFIRIARKKILKHDTLLPSMSGAHLQNLERGMIRKPGTDILTRWLGIVDANGRFCDQSLDHFVKRRKSEQYNHTNMQETINNADDGTHRFDNDDEFDRRHLDDDSDFLQDIFRSSHTTENISVEIPDYYKNQHGKRFHQSHRKQIETIIENKIQEPDIMTQEEANSTTGIWGLEIPQRWRLYRSWVKLFIEQTHVQLRRETEEFRRRKEEFDDFILREQMEALQGTSVIGVTTTGAAKYHQLLREIGPPIVIIEEAAEVLEAHVITSLTCDCQHLILIGDHQQLRPSPTVYELCKHYKLDISLFERLIRNGMPCHRLSRQHRMKPEISHLLKIHKDFYPDLSDHQKVKRYEGIRGVEKDIYFIDHDCPEQSTEENKSRSNLHEAAFMISLCNYLLQQGYTSDQITILTAYRGQVWNIKDLQDRKDLKGVRVCPIDNFQGEENDIILISFVRSNEEGNIGFLKVPNRVCVALSRAKKGLYCIGNFTVMSEKSDLWKVIINDLRRRELIGRHLRLTCQNHQNSFTEVSYAADFDRVSDGGCNEPCNARLNCGHTCQKKCHPEDNEHRNIRCSKPCDKKCSAQLHKCRRLCYEECKVHCKELVKKVLPCSHEQLAECFVDAEKVKCMSKCEKILPCDHRCQEMCFEKCTEKCSVVTVKTFQPCGHQSEVPCFQTECPQTCKTLLKCGHPCRGTCGKCNNGRFHLKCEDVCKRILVCGHECQSNCSNTCPPCRKPCENRCEHNHCTKPCGENCISCIEPCVWKCPHMTCKTKCGDECDRKVCDKSCWKKLKCGHRCIGLCGEPCPQLCRKCDKDKVTEILFGDEDESDAKFVFLEECGHIVEVKAMDRLMDMSSSSDQEEIKLPECPWCKSSIRFNPRYNNKIKAIRRDVEQVKRQILGHGGSFDEQFERLKLRIANVHFHLASMAGRATDSNNGGKKMDVKIKNSHIRMCEGIDKIIKQKRKLLTLSDLSKLETQLDMFEKLKILYKDRMSLVDNPQAKNDETDVQLKCFEKDYLFLLNKTKSFVLITEQEIDDWQSEYNRCRYRITFARVLKAFKQPGVKLEELKKEKEMLEEVQKLLSGIGKFCNKKQAKVGNILKELKTINPLLASIGITEKERDMVVKAMGFTRGHWFKCSNGHVYAIGECGGAMQKSKCPECKASIGGESHKLEEGNAVASEMDGALHPAYSEEANNVMNYADLV